MITKIFQTIKERSINDAIKSIYMREHKNKKIPRMNLLAENFFFTK